MILGADGTRLSKRHGATSVAAYRDLGYLPEALDNFLALLGWSYDGKQELFTLAELERRFRLERVGSNPSVFNLEKLEWINGQHLKRLDEADRVARVRDYLAQRGHDLSERSTDWTTAFVRALGDRLKTLADAERYGAFVLSNALEMDEVAWNELREKPEVAGRLEALASRLEADASFSLASLEALTRGLAGDLAIKAGELIGLARVALTGKSFSPGIFEVMWLLGRERAVARLRSAAARWLAESPHARV
jgi:glutamyl/glutaminyl-tRNA synthetase